MRWVPCFFTYTGSFTGFAGTRKKSKAMCQLLGMNCNTPTDVRFSFSGFSQRAGNTGDHTDGWGIAFFEGKGLRQFVDRERASTSPIAQLIRNYAIKSENVIAHIRKATQGQVALENCHPFVRERCGASIGCLPTTAIWWTLRPSCTAIFTPSAPRTASWPFAGSCKSWPSPTPACPRCTS